MSRDAAFHYFHPTDGSFFQEHVHGILLFTPTSLMFDPDPTCPLAMEHGCERFGVMVDMKNIVTLTMYRDTGIMKDEL